MNKTISISSPTKGDILLAKCGFRFNHVIGADKEPQFAQYVYTRNQGETIRIYDDHIDISIICEGKPEDTITFDPSQNAVSLHSLPPKQWYTPSELYAIAEKANELDLFFK